MKLAIGYRCVMMTDAWKDLETYQIEDIESSTVVLRRISDYLRTEDLRRIEGLEIEKIFVSPYQAEVRNKRPKTHAVAAIIDDLAGALLGATPRISVDDLIAAFKAEWRLAHAPGQFLEGCLRSKVASKDFHPFVDGRKKDADVMLELSPRRRELERTRVFAGTFAHELHSLSERIRNLVQHTGTVGTYREHLLQTLLRKNLPERYHVATGFIHGCSRQLDIVIYDRIDYAPLFREEDLVVVPVDSVRAVIEVKTVLNSATLRDSLSLLSDVSHLDDLNPPFFKGIFAFESPTKAEEIYSSVHDFYAGELPENFDDIDSELWPSHITDPYRHVTSICVLGHAYAQIDFARDERWQYAPTLFCGSSASGLAAQAAYFLQRLLNYLKFDGLKSTNAQPIATMLGADTRWAVHSKLVVNEQWSWGPYFVRDEMAQNDHGVVEMEKLIEDVMEWLKGARWN